MVKFFKRSFYGMGLAIIRVVGKPRVMTAVRFACAISRRFNSSIHGLNFRLHWGVPPHSAWQDQYTTLHYLWQRESKPDLAERGCMSLLGMAWGAEVLEICSGDGFFTKHFHACRAKSVIGVDFDPAVVHFARQFNHAPNVSYAVCDIRSSMPEGSFDNIIWNGAIQAFVEAELDGIMASIKARLRVGALLSGYTYAEIPDMTPLSHQKQGFHSKEDLGNLLARYFNNIKVIESKWPPSVHNLYFYASDGHLPLDEGWEAQWEWHTPPTASANANVLAN